MDGGSTLGSFTSSCLIQPFLNTIKIMFRCGRLAITTVAATTTTTAAAFFMNGFGKSRIPGYRAPPLISMPFSTTPIAEKVLQNPKWCVYRSYNTLCYHHLDCLCPRRSPYISSMTHNAIYQARFLAIHRC